MRKISPYLTDDNYERLDYLIGPNRVYKNMTDASNDLIRRALPIVENETGFKKKRRV